ncbi:MAG: glycosyltransferase, partial [Candidatus Latescibacteria bacterium]|nr:glycosyltransferase [Candidatus Latescibacterota bacterium]
RENLGIKKDDLFLIYAGRLDVEKRVSFLVEAFNKLPNNISAMLVLIGDGPLKDSIQSSGNGKIIVLPYVTDKPELARILDSADIYVTAGPFETFGLSVLEAQASGLPVVGVKAGALIERVPQSVGLLGDKDSPEEMTANIVQLAQGNYKNMGYHARKMVESEFTWTRTFENILQLYSTL